MKPDRTLDEFPNPFAAALDGGRPARQRFWRSFRFLVIVLAATAGLLGASVYAKTMLIAHLRSNFDTLTDDEQQTRLIQLAGFGIDGLPALAEQLFNDRDAVSETAFALLRDQQDQSVTWPAPSRLRAHQLLVDELTQQIARVDLSAIPPRSAARARELLRRIILDSAGDVSAATPNDLLATAQGTMDRLLTIARDDASPPPGPSIVSPPTMSLAGRRGTWTDWPPQSGSNDDGSRSGRDWRENTDDLPVTPLTPLPPGAAVPLQPAPAASRLTRDDLTEDSAAIATAHRPAAQILRANATLPGNVMTAMASESVLRHLGQTDAGLAEQAETELLRRGFSPDEVHLGRQFAVAAPTQRIELVDQLVRQSAGDPMPWLAMLLQDTDRGVRLHIVSLLSTTPTHDARGLLRRHLQTESDPHVATRIRRALNLR